MKFSKLTIRILAWVLSSAAHAADIRLLNVSYDPMLGVGEYL